MRGQFVRNKHIISYQQYRHFIRVDYINDKGHKVLEYLSPNTIVLDLHFIMTTGKRLTVGMPYLKLESKNIGEDIAAIRLLGFQDYEGMIYLNVQDIKTNRCYNLTWNMEIDDDWWFWSLADFETLTEISE